MVELGFQKKTSFSLQTAPKQTIEWAFLFSLKQIKYAIITTHINQDVTTPYTWLVKNHVMSLSISFECKLYVSIITIKQDIWCF